MTAHQRAEGERATWDGFGSILSPDERQQRRCVRSATRALADARRKQEARHTDRQMNRRKGSTKRRADTDQRSASTKAPSSTQEGEENPRKQRISAPTSGRDGREL
ncbi:hypothetical protein HPB50_009757 [Hyalomma asiaticum]|uniref:Uncharacterized protein n=1 Tax=Hyalomma asiaticum TaxID=266040 RepID=A0ACB7RZ20_HYAAI|nr:hypothetical protein HPB50_009757 [Hyalomma asiaticum]